MRRSVIVTVGEFDETLTLSTPLALSRATLRRPGLGAPHATVEARGMANLSRCSAMTKAGRPCQWDAGACKHHPSAVAREGTAASEAPALREPPPSLAARDISGTAWWLAAQLLSGAIETPVATAATALLRLVAGLPAGVESDDVLDELILRGRLMHGFPPADEHGWQMLEERFTPDAVAEVKRWAARFEALSEELQSVQTA